MAVTLDANDVPSTKKLNAQVGQLAETPTSEQVKTVTASVTNPADANKLQDQIDALILEKRKIEEDLRKEVSQLTEANAKLKQQQKDTQAELDKFDSPWYSIKNGFLIVFRRFAWWGGGFVVVFILLRLFAASNPIIGAIYAVFSHMVAAVVKGLVKVFPQLLSHVGAVNEDVHEAKSAVLSKLVDEIQAVGKEASVAELKDALAKRLDSSDKALIKTVKTDLGY